MLDIDTRRRIDTARDILVGKVPDPKSQVEQITIALIYKFMDDMDAESEELGGKRTFFAGEFARFGWAQLMAPGLGGHETLARYAEAITRMPENPGVPALFRDIFKNAYLPYRDPETLRAFLKVIGEFSYDHSERLGDAFEYLLSVLGSQGDAGQFRTPRHIIDFMVAIVDPRADDTILDPACGTAGFLISAWKHIMAANAAGGRPGAALSPERRKRLLDNVRGYDISPDMVRLSLVNLYLHGFNDPHIYEYDTLTSDERWNEYATVILANPPFMSPKGGIRPHKRFSVQSNRSEVLFVDYIAEHLAPGGRAAIIVPEGVIFQSGNAYVKLRQLMLSEHLSAVISLPSGVFQPYTGVKTSILVFDRALAKTRPDILFSDIKHIGMSLGVKRTPTEHNDLPQVLDDYRTFAATGAVDSQVSFTVPREHIADNGYLLDLKRYRNPDADPSHYRMVALGEVCRVEKGKSSSTKTLPGSYPLVLTAEQFGTADHYDFEETAVCVPLISSSGHGKATMKRVHFCEGPFALADLLAAVTPKDPDELNVRYLYRVLDAAKESMTRLMSGAANVSMKTGDLAHFQIPLPPLPIQEALVAEVESYQRIIDGSRQVVANWRPRIEVDAEWPVVALGEVLLGVSSGATPLGGRETYVADGVLFIRSQNVLWGECDLSDAAFISQETHESMSRSQLRKDDVLLNITGASIGRSAVFDLDCPANVNQHVTFLRVNDKVLPRYLMNTLISPQMQEQIMAVQAGASRQALNYQQIRSLPIPLPDVGTQEQLISDIEEERAIVQANRDLITRYERKIRERIGRVWGEGKS